MIITTFATAAIISALSGIIIGKKRFFKAFKQSKLSCLYLIITSLVFALGINLIVIIIPHFDTTILYTLDNSSVLIMSVLISCIFFKEKLSAINTAGIAVMVSALVGMNLLPPLLDKINDWKWMNIPFAVITLALPIVAAVSNIKKKEMGVLITGIISVSLIMINLAAAFF